MFCTLARTVLSMTSTLMMSASLYALGGDIFLGTITDPISEDFISRTLITFNEDGTMIITNSDQQGEPQYAPFGMLQGYWEKCGDTIVYKAVDFTYPKFVTCDGARCCEDQMIAVASATLHKECDGQFEGPLQVDFFPLDIDINNLGPPFFSLEQHIVLDRIKKLEECSSSSSCSTTVSSSDEAKME